MKHNLDSPPIKTIVGVFFAIAVAVGFLLIRYNKSLNHSTIDSNNGVVGRH